MGAVGAMSASNNLPVTGDVLTAFDGRWPVRAPALQRRSVFYWKIGASLRIHALLTREPT